MNPTPDDFDAIERTLRAEGPGAAVDLLLQTLSDRDESRALLDALLLEARRDLGLPAVPEGPASTLPEPLRTKYEDRYAEALKLVGARLLAAGKIAAAWPYFHLLGEPGPVAQALEDYRPESGDPGIGEVVDLAFRGGANPRRGFELILDHFGICSAITAFEGLPPSEEVRDRAAGLLIHRLHDQLRANLRAEIASKGDPEPPADAALADLLEGRDDLFADEAFHVDVSHLAAVVRLGLLSSDLEAIRLASELADYGRRLSPRLRPPGDPPFSRTYEDHALYFDALLGLDAEAALDHFRAQVPPPDPDGDASVSDTVPAQVLVGLLARLGRLDEAIEVASEHLGGLPDAALFCPSLASLCLQAGRLDRLAESARRRGDLVRYAEALIAAGAARADSKSDTIRR